MVRTNQTNTENPFGVGDVHSRLSRSMVTFLRRSHVMKTTEKD